MKARLLAVAHAWRENWRATRDGTKVIVVLLASVIIAWTLFAVWFWMAWDF